MTWSLAAVGSAMIALAVGCGGGETSAGTSGTGGSAGGSGSSTTGAGGACTISPTFAEVIATPLQSCAGLEPPCHKANAGSMYIDAADPAMTWSSIVNVPATIKKAGIRVVPGDPASSFLYRKLTNDLEAHEGAPMPKSPFPNGMWTELPADQIEMVRCWIQEGAPKK